MIQAAIALLKANKAVTGVSGASGVVLILLTMAYIDQDKAINNLSLELGSLRATVKYNEIVIDEITDRYAELNEQCTLR